MRANNDQGCSVSDTASADGISNLEFTGLRSLIWNCRDGFRNMFRKIEISTKSTSLLAEATLISWDRNSTKMSVSKQTIGPSEVKYGEGTGRAHWHFQFVADNYKRVRTADPKRLLVLASATQTDSNDIPSKTSAKLLTFLKHFIIENLTIIQIPHLHWVNVFSKELILKTVHAITLSPT
jgi:hypothetical protein